MKAGWIAALGMLLSATHVDAEHAIELVTGELLRGEIVEWDDARILLVHDMFGRMEIPIDAVEDVSEVEETPASVNRPAEDAPKVEETVVTSPEVVSDAPPVVLEPETEAAEPASPWDTQIELGYNAREGTTQDSNFRASVRTERTTPESIFRFDATYRLSSNRGDRTENNLTTGVFFEWPQPGSRWSHFAQGRFDIAEFQSYDQRYTGSAGVGYRLLDLQGVTDRGAPTSLVLTTRAGGGVRQEVGSEMTDIAPEGLLGGEMLYRMNDEQTIALVSTWHPDFSDSGEFRLVSSGNWTMKLTELDGTSFRLGFTHEYQSRTDVGIPHFDLAVFAALLVDF